MNARLAAIEIVDIEWNASINVCLPNGDARVELKVAKDSISSDQILYQKTVTEKQQRHGLQQGARVATRREAWAAGGQGKQGKQGQGKGEAGAAGAAGAAATFSSSFYGE